MYIFPPPGAMANVLSLVLVGDVVVISMQNDLDGSRSVAFRLSSGLRVELPSSLLVAALSGRVIRYIEVNVAHFDQTPFQSMS